MWSTSRAAAPRFTHDLYRETILDGLSPSTRAEINLAVGRALQARSADAARIAAHLLRPERKPQQAAIDYSIRAARVATARLGHDDACAHYLRHCRSSTGSGPRRASMSASPCCSSWPRRTNGPGSRSRPGERYRRGRRHRPRSRRRGDARARRSGAARAGTPVGRARVRRYSSCCDAAARLLEESDGSLTLQSRVAAALAREMRHGTIRAPDAETIRMARPAVELATAAGDARALAVAKLALQDSMWRPGTRGAAAARHRATCWPRRSRAVTPTWSPRPTCCVLPR